MASSRGSLSQSYDFRTKFPPFNRSLSRIRLMRTNKASLEIIYLKGDAYENRLCLLDPRRLQYKF